MNNVTFPKCKKHIAVEYKGDEMSKEKLCYIAFFAEDEI